MGALASLNIAASLFATELTAVRTVVVIVSGVATVLVAYVQFYVPITRFDERRRQSLLRYMLRTFVKDYRATNPGITNLRGNVALVHHLGWRRRPSLKIKYVSEGYSHEELEIWYDPGIGCSGLALQARDQIWYDSQASPAAVQNMPHGIYSLTAHLNSILSTPIFADNDSGRERPIAVFNLDSTDPVSVTQFNSSDNLDKTAQFATLVGQVL
jgi:hypothetical protein